MQKCELLTVDVDRVAWMYKRSISKLYTRVSQPGPSDPLEATERFSGVTSRGLY